MRLEPIRSRPLLAIAIAGAALGLAGGLAVAPPPGVDPSPQTQVHWSLPEASQIARYDEKDFAQVRNSPMWRSAAQTQAAAIRWKIVGAVADGSRRFALIAVEGTPELLRIGDGDSLPGGEGRVIKVGNFGMHILINGCDEILRLYTPSQRRPKATCDNPAPPPRAEPAPGTAAPKQGSPRFTPPRPSPSSPSVPPPTRPAAARTP